MQDYNNTPAPETVYWGTSRRGNHAVVKTVYAVIWSCSILVVTIAAGLQFGAPWRLTDDWVATFGLVPSALMVIAILRDPITIPSWLVFGCGIVMDTLSHGVVGYWALTYTMCTLLARLVPNWFSIRLSMRICAHGLIVLSIFMLHIILSWIGFAGKPAWIEAGWATMRVFFGTVMIELTLASLACFSFRVRRFEYVTPRAFSEKR